MRKLQRFQLYAWHHLVKLKTIIGVSQIKSLPKGLFAKGVPGRNTIMWLWRMDLQFLIHVIQKEWSHGCSSRTFWSFYLKLQSFIQFRMFSHCWWSVDKLSWLFCMKMCMQTEHKYCIHNTFSCWQCWHTVNIMHCDA